jgi:hypothetical protein
MPFLYKPEAGFIDFFWLDTLQAPEVIINALPLPAGPAIKLLFNQMSYALPWSEMGWKGRAEKGDYGCGG